MRVLCGAFGDPGHAFPIIALGRALAARGHDVCVQTWTRWQADVEAGGMRFAAAPEYHVFPSRERPLKPYEAVRRAASETVPLVDELRPDAVVSDILTLAPALAGELRGVPVATLVPHLDPRPAPELPPYSIGARPPRSALGRRLWRAVDPLMARGLEQGRAELNETRRRLGLPPHAHVHGGISRALCLLATFPQLEAVRTLAPATHAVGPLLWEPPFEDEPPDVPGDGPLVLVAPSTSQDPSHQLLRATLEGLAGERVRVLATWNRRVPDPPLGPVPPNATVVEWLRYSSAMARADLVVCHGGHGTVARSLSHGVPVVVVPAAGDMNENAARADWAGVGVRLPRRLCTPRAVRLAVRRALREDGLRTRARELAAWTAAEDPATRAARVVEAFPSAGR